MRYAFLAPTDVAVGVVFGAGAWFGVVFEGSAPLRIPSGLHPQPNMTTKTAIARNPHTRLFIDSIRPPHTSRKARDEWLIGPFPWVID